MPEYRIAINLRPKDYLGFMGKDIWHGNAEIGGSGIRLTVVSYIKKDLIGKNYDQEIAKTALKMLNSISQKETQT